MDSVTNQLLNLTNQTIQEVEALEQEVIALKNEQPTELEIMHLRDQVEEAKRLIHVITTERNTLSQVVRIQASQGRIDPVQETVEKEMIENTPD